MANKKLSPSVNTNPNINPILPIAGVPDQFIQAINDRFREVRLAPAAQTPAGSSESGGGGIDWRTLLVRKCVVANDVADHLPLMGTSSNHRIVLVRAILGRAINSDLTVRINSVFNGVTSVIGTFTLPSSTALDTVVDFSSFTTGTVQDASVFTWDITAGDGSRNQNGIATFTVVFEE